MENNIFIEFGKKLNVEPSEIDPKKSSNWFKKYLFWMINALNLVLSSLLGLIIGLNEKEDGPPSYPYRSAHSDRIYLGVGAINIVNGIISLLPQRNYSNKNQIVRIGIVFLNLIVSLTISHVIYASILSIPPPPFFNIVPAYSVYKSPATNNI